MEVEKLISRGKLLNMIYERTKQGSKSITYKELVTIISRLPSEEKVDWRMP